MSVVQLFRHRSGQRVLAKGLGLGTVIVDEPRMGAAVVMLDKEAELRDGRGTTITVGLAWVSYDMIERLPQRPCPPPAPWSAA
jgi:hypothetical protein